MKQDTSFALIFREQYFFKRQQGRRKHFKLGGHDASRTLFPLDKRGIF